MRGTLQNHRRAPNRRGCPRFHPSSGFQCQGTFHLHLRQPCCFWGNKMYIWVYIFFLKKKSASSGFFFFEKNETERKTHNLSSRGMSEQHILDAAVRRRAKILARSGERMKLVTGEVADLLVRWLQCAFGMGPDKTRNTNLSRCSSFS